jgi:O-antigen/teichoic acid export membrane protein
MSTPPVQPRGSAAGRLARNAALTASAEVLSKLFSLAFFVLLARQFGDATLGHYVFALAVTSLIWSLAGFGLDRMATRDIAREPDQLVALVTPIAAIKLAVSGAAVVICAAVLAVAGFEREVVLLVLILGANVSFSLAAYTAHTVFIAFERTEHVFLTKVPWSFASALVGIAVVALGGDIVAAALGSALAVGLFGTTWTVYLLLRHYPRPSGTLHLRSWPALLKRALPFGYQEMLGQIIFRFDTVLLALLAASSVVGAYGAAYRMLESTLFLAWSVGYAVMPMYSYLAGRALGGSLELVYEGSLKLIVAVMAPIATVLFVCAEPIVDLLYGLPQYEATVPVLRLLTLAVAVYGFGHLAGLLVIVRRPGRVTVAAMSVVAVLNVVACLALIPWLGAEGAAIATVGSELLLAVLGVVLARPVVGLPRLGWVLVAPVVGCLAMAAAMAPLTGSLWLALPAGAVAYVLAFLLVERGRLREDIALLRSIAARRPDTPVVT